MAKARARFIGLSCYVPSVRMMALVGWAKVSSAGVVETHGEAYDVLGIVNCMVQKGGVRYLSQETQICCDDDVMTLQQARDDFFPPCNVAEVVACPWPREFDEEKLGGRIQSVRSKFVLAK